LRTPPSRIWAFYPSALLGCSKTQRLVLAEPAAFVVSASSAGVGEAHQLLAEYLHKVTGLLDVNHWRQRLARLLQRPAEEGPALVLLIDGLNQRSQVDWTALLQKLQDKDFSGKLRFVVTTRNYHFDDKLRGLRSLAYPPKRIEVGVYDDPELDTMLGFEILGRGDLPPDLISWARRPRLFALVVKFRERLSDPGSVTPHRLIWEYGMDTLGPQSGRSFTEQDWREWLQDLAQRTIANAGSPNFTSRTLAESAARPDLTTGDIFGRMSDLIDGSFVSVTERGLQPTASTIAHALGLALLHHLDGQSPGQAGAALTGWLDTIAGFDEQTEVLRAAVSIMVSRQTTPPPYAATLLLSWLQSQNLPESHVADVVALARALVAPLLQAIEESSAVQRSARLYAVNALRSIPRKDLEVRELIMEIATRWLSRVSRDVDSRNPDSDDQKARSAQLVQRVGRDSSGPIIVLCRQLELVVGPNAHGIETIPSLLEDFPLVHALPVFEVAASSLAISRTHGIWDELKWLVLLNPVDRDETTAAIRQRSVEIESIIPEQHVHPEVAKRVAANLLWLNSTDEDSIAAGNIPNSIYPKWDYQSDYLDKPGASFFPLERRHAASVMRDASISPQSRMSRGKRLIHDPTFELPSELIEEVRATTTDFPVERLDEGISPTNVDIALEHMEPLLARGAADALFALIQRKLQSLDSVPGKDRYWMALRLREHVLAWSDDAAVPAKNLRLRVDPSDNLQLLCAAANLIMIEVMGLPSIDQVRAILAAGLGDNVDFEEIVGPLGAEESDLIVEEFRSDEAAVSSLSTLLLLTRSELGETARDWLYQLAFNGSKEEQRSVASNALWQHDANRFGRELQDMGWGWRADYPYHVNHFGSLAIGQAASALPFDELASRLAPWVLMSTVRQRRQSASETLLAAQFIDVVLQPRDPAMPEIGSEIIVYLDKRETNPFAFSLKPRVNHDGEGLSAFISNSEAFGEARESAINYALKRIVAAKNA
jgi:hypothetical protein